MENVESCGKLFADDAKFYRKINTPSDGEKLQEYINWLQEWSYRWLLQFNEDKHKVMHLGRGNLELQYHMGNTLLSSTVEEKDLEVYVTPSLKPTVQVAEAAGSAKAVVGRLRKTYTYQDTEMFLTLREFLIRPRLEHCIHAWAL